MAGGRGERFWPMSQPHLPKQFLNVFNNTPLIVQTMNRIKNHFKRDERILIVPEELQNITRKYVGRERIVIEPMRRNTGAAICLAAMLLKRDYGDGVMHVMPADHLISPQKHFINALTVGHRLAENGYLVTYGIRPNRPETGYGYIKIGKKLNQFHKIRAFRGAGFTEKPNSKRAKDYVKSKKYVWNSGIFTLRISDILSEIEHFMPRVYRGVADYVRRKKKKYFERIPDVSIDYGVMEKSKKLCVVDGNFLWDDVGSWLALERYFQKDKNDNILIGNVRGLETEHSILYTSGVPLKAYGVKGLIVVVSPHGVLVSKKEKAQDLKQLLK